MEDLSPQEQADVLLPPEQTNVLLPPEQAIELLLREIDEKRRTETLPLNRASGRILAETVYAGIDVPSFDRSAVDGYALRASDTASASDGSPVSLEIVGEIMAGTAWGAALADRQALRIMTGAPVPDAADCVIRQEDTSGDGVKLLVSMQLIPGQNIGVRGEDIRYGACIAEAGAKLTYAHIGLLAAIGMTHVQVFAQVYAGILSTGDELIQPGEPLGNAKIYNSNLYTLSERVKELGIGVRFMTQANDDVGEICEIIDSEIDGVDLLLSTGGVSVGQRDCMHEVLRRLGARRLFWRLAIRPGTPVLAAVYRGKLLLCLSGSHFAAATNLELLGRPVLAKLSGDDSIMYTRREAVMGEALHKAGPMRRFVRAICSDGIVRLHHDGDGTGGVERLSGESGSLLSAGNRTPGSRTPGALLSMIDCNALIDIPAGAGPLAPGDPVRVIML